MAISTSASIMSSQAAAMIPQPQLSDANRIVRDTPNDNPIATKSSEPLNSIPSRSIPAADAISPQNASTTSKPADQTQQERSAQQQVDQVISQLKARDREVRAHEQAHLAAAGSYATSGASYSYQTGPDGKRYAIGGEVGIDTSPIANDPQATLQKAMVVQQAALAPAQPSSQDMRVASVASQMMAEARAEISEQQRAEVASSEAVDEVTQGNPTDESHSLVEQNEQPPSIAAYSEPVSAPQSDDIQQLAMARSQFETRLSLSRGFLSS